MIDGSQAIQEAILSCGVESQLPERSRPELEPIRIQQRAYLSNRIEQDHRAIKKRIRPMLRFQSVTNAHVIRSGIEMLLVMRKQQAKYACNRQKSLA